MVCFCGHIEVEAREHEAEEDDGDCTTAVSCKRCEVVVIEAKTHDFNGAEWQKDEDGHWRKCVHSGCSVAEEKSEHQKQDDGNCETAVVCFCGHIEVEAREHEPEEDDGDCTTDIMCKNCDQVAVFGEETHTEGEDGKCSICGTTVTVSHQHIWGEVEYSWNEDCTECVATRVCQEDESHIESESASVSFTETGDCETGRAITFTATFANQAFESCVRTKTFEAGHDYVITYHWEYGDGVCHAKRVCQYCGDVSNEEIAMRENLTLQITGSCAEGGVVTRTAIFADSVFETQIKTEAFEAGEHVFRGECSVNCESCGESVRTDIEASDHTILRDQTNFQCDVCMNGSTFEGWAPDSDDSEFGEP